ncbi:hypothetical protein [Williamsia sp. M5A3_1d]
MRPIDHVHEPLPTNRFWYNSRGWRGQILPVMFMVLIVTSAVIGASGAVPWWTWWVQGTVIAVLMVTANILVRRLLRRIP